MSDKRSSMIKATDTRVVTFNRQTPKDATVEVIVARGGWTVSELEDLCRAARRAGGQDASVVDFGDGGGFGPSKYSATLIIETDLLANAEVSA